MQGSSSFSISSEKGFKKDVLENKEPVIVDFYADWCGPCKKLAPVLEKICTQSKTFKLAKVNIDANQDLAEEYEVSGIPDVRLFFEGKEIMAFQGLDLNKLKEMVEKTKTLSINKPFGGSGTVLDKTSVAVEEITEEMAKIFFDLESQLPNEPSADDSNAYTIVFKFNDLSFTRRFADTDTIKVLKMFIKAKIKTLKEVELFEPFPSKIYNDETKEVKSSGLSKNQILMVRLL